MALTTPSTALGMLLGGPVVGAVGGRPTLLGSAVLTIALGVLVGAAVAVRAARPGGARGSGHYDVPASRGDGGWGHAARRAR